MLTLVRRLLALRRANPALHVGSMAEISVANDVLSIERRAGDVRIGVALNFSDEIRPVRLAPGTLLLSAYGDDGGASTETIGSLRPNEAVVYRYDSV